MHYVNIHEAKTHLSKYLEILAAQHEPIIICRNGKPIAQIIEYKPGKNKKLGLLKGQIKMSKDFDSLPNEFMDFFE